MATPERRSAKPDPLVSGDGAAAVRVPGSSDSSSPDSGSSSDSPTIMDWGTDRSGSRSDIPTFVDIGGSRSDSRGSPVTPVSAARVPGLFEILPPQTILGQRFEIVGLLGQGGMGSVYKARDLELNRMVALKVIRPELAGNPGIIERFKQELILAHQVTHKNVIRIYDLAEADGLKFTTMEFIEGEDLRSLILEKKKLPPEEAVEIIRQACRALEAAHSVGVIHRDLKPGNIMRDKTGRVLVMDFGLARTLEGAGMTRTGALVGTMEYMSPEQALGKDLDARSDLFALGLIFFELLTGNMPYKADTALASLIKRTQERAVTVSDYDHSIPPSLSNIVSKCLERDLTLRYQSAGEILADLEQWEGKRAAASLTFPAIRRWSPSVAPWVGLMAMLVVLTVVGVRYRGALFTRTSSTSATAVRPDVSLAILPLRNASGDAALDWLGPSVADMLSTDVGQSAHLRTISPDRLHQVLSDLQITANVVVDPTMLRRIAEFSGADTIVWGQYAKFGDTIRIDATLQDLKHDRRVPLKVEVATEREVPGGVDQLAGSIRQNLAVSPDVVKELQASSFQPTSKSLPALRDYNQGLQLLRDGKNLDAQKALEASTKEDPAFALAFSKLGQTYGNLGYDSDAEQAAQKAVDLSENLPQAEKYLIAAIHAQVTRNYPEAIQSYENLAKAAPDNADVQAALGGLYEDSGDFAKANEYYQKMITANSKDIMATISIGRIALKQGNAQPSLEPLNRALSLSIQVGNDEEKATCLHDIGYAYELLNKNEESLSNYQQALDIRRRIKDKRGIAKSLNKIARIEAALGKTKPASAHFEEALQVSRDIGDKRGQGDTLLDLGNLYDGSGDHDKSLKLYKESLQIERDLGNEDMQAMCLNNIGSEYFSKGEYQDALTYFQQALQLREKANVPADVVESVHNIAETAARMGNYEQAVTQYIRALDLRRKSDDARGGAIEAYSMGTLFDYQGRFGAAINSKQDALKTFRGLKDRTFWMAEILGGYAEALTLAGRGPEAQPYLDEALNLSRELKNDGLVAQTLAFQGDVSYYLGDANAARSYYDRALQAATRSKEPDKVLIAKADLARAELKSGGTAAGITSLRSLAKQAQEEGFAYIAVECSVDMGDAMLRSHDSSHARPELERALLQADKLGLKPLSAKAHYLLGTALRTSGAQAEAQQHYRSAVQALDAMRTEAGGEKILQRSDFKAIYDDASRWAQIAKN